MTTPQASGRRRGRWLNLALVLVLVAAVAGGAWLLFAPPTAQAAERTTTVQRGTVTETVTATGTVESAGELTASFPSAGVVTEVDVEVGEKVTAGQVLARIDGASARQQVASATSGYAQALASKE